MSQNGANMSNGQNVNGQNNANVDVRHTYTIPGIVQYLQYEWQRFELHRQQWEVSVLFFILNVSVELFFIYN